MLLKYLFQSSLRKFINFGGLLWTYILLESPVWNFNIPEYRKVVQVWRNLEHFKREHAGSSIVMYYSSLTSMLRDKESQ